MTSYGGGTAATNYITDQAAYKADQATEAAGITHSTTTSNTADDYLDAYANLDTSTTSGTTTSDATSTVDDWLSDFYAEHGINEGKVDQTGRDYWTKQLQTKSQAEVEKDILWAAANN